MTDLYDRVADSFSLHNLLSMNELLPISVCFFLLGFIGLVESREFLRFLVSSELVMLAINFNIIASSLAWGDASGQAYALCILAVTAAETAIGLGLLILLYSGAGPSKGTGLVSLSSLRG